MLFEKYDPLKISKEGGRGILEEGNLFQIIDKDGKVDEMSLKEGFKNGWNDLSDPWLRQVYEEMTFVRMADDKILKLQRQGRMGTYGSLKGQEATQVGSIHALTKKDWVVPAFRELGAMLLHGVPLVNIYRYWGGFEFGSKMPEGVNVLPVSIPVGTHPLHAVGIAWASKFQKKDYVVMTFFSDGATSEGDFHEAMNFAGVFKVPCVFLCQNNQWAISVPRKKQTASKTLAQKAIAYQIPAMQVDGNDVLAIYAASVEAVSRARNGEGPFFIEAVTYRQSDHTTADDSRKYRSQGEMDYWLDRDPIKRMKLFLQSRGWWDEKWQADIEARSTERINQAVSEYEATPIPPPEYIFQSVHGEITLQLQEQLDYLKSFFP